MNLLANVCKYQDTGRPGRSGGDARTAREVVVRVRDAGVGIAREMLPATSSPFTQLNLSLDRTDRGLGSGLSLARSLVELAWRPDPGVLSEGLGKGGGGGGEAAGGGEPGRRRLSRGRRSSRSRRRWAWRLRWSSSMPVSPSQRAPRHRVLIAEDNVDLADLLQEQLVEMGQEVRVANDGWRRSAWRCRSSGGAAHRHRASGADGLRRGASRAAGAGAGGGNAGGGEAGTEGRRRSTLAARRASTGTSPSRCARRRWR